MESYISDDLFSRKAQMQPLRRVVLCGSTRFLQAFQEANLRETLAGNIVLTIGCDTRSDDGLDLTERDKFNLDLLHLHKIDLADEVLILNVGGYIGRSVVRELIYAAYLQKPVCFLEPEHCVVEVCSNCGCLYHSFELLWVHASCGCLARYVLRVNLVRDCV